jgi:membrane protein implicated in regulation of membrane protease activity
VAYEEIGEMKSLFWWLRHDRIGRSRLFVLALVAAVVIGWAVFGWPTTESTVIVVPLSLLGVVGDYFFWRRDLRKAGKPVPGVDQSV